MPEKWQNISFYRLFGFHWRRQFMHTKQIFSTWKLIASSRPTSAQPPTALINRIFILLKLMWSLFSSNRCNFGRGWCLRFMGSCGQYRWIPKRQLQIANQANIAGTHGQSRRIQRCAGKKLSARYAILSACHVYAVNFCRRCAPWAIDWTLLFQAPSISKCIRPLSAFIL